MASLLDPVSRAHHGYLSLITPMRADAMCRAHHGYRCEASAAKSDGISLDVTDLRRRAGIHARFSTLRVR